MKVFFWFNLMCLSISAFFAVGTFWLWRDHFGTIALERLAVISQTNNIRIQIADNRVKSPEGDHAAGNEKVSSTIEKTIISKPLPKEFNLAVPFTSQAPEKNWEEPWQDACEEAALLMLDAYYKGYGLSPIMARDEILKMVAWEEEKKWDISIPIVDIKQMAEDYYFFSSRGATATRDLSKSINFDNSQNVVTSSDSGKKDSSPSGLGMNVRIIENPTIEQIKKYIASGNPVLAVADGKVLSNPHFRNGGPVYHALVIKGYDEDEFITNDPGTQFGADFKYKYADLMNAIHDWNGGDVPHGRQVILVIE